MVKVNKGLSVKCIKMHCMHYKSRGLNVVSQYQTIRDLPAYELFHIQDVSGSEFSL